MNGKTVLIFVVSIAFFTLAARYRFLDSAHAIGTLRQGGGVARHPALLDKDKDSYILIATAGVVPPYHGNARVVLEGDPGLKASFHNSGPAMDLGIHRRPEFRDSTYYDLKPRDRIALWVKIKRNLKPQQQQAASASTQKPERGALPPCTQCDTEAGGTATEASRKNSYGEPVANSRGNLPESVKRSAERTAREEKSPGNAGAGKRWQGKGSGAIPEKGPALAFYDTTTNEPPLRIPIRFTGGGDNAH